MRWTHLLLLAGIFTAFASCKQDSRSGEVMLAKVEGSVLYLSDLGEIGKGKDPADSAEAVRIAVNSWVRETLMLKQAEKNLAEDQLNISKMVDDYRRSVITYRYEAELVRQKLDTVIGDEEIAAYYEQNKSNFELKDNIIKVIYVKVRQNAPGVNKVSGWYASNKEKDKESLRNYCLQYAENFYLDENSWLLFDDILKEIPIKLYDKEAFLQNNRRIETKDSTYLYYVNILGFMTRKSESPLSFEKENIRHILLNKRKVEFIKKMRESLYNEAIRNKEVEIY